MISGRCVVQTDNEPRARDGYTRTCTNDHARALPAGSEPAFSRTNVLANDRVWTRVTLPNLHGKEGVDGSSPSEGFTKGQQMACFVASPAYAHRSIIPQPVPKIRPRRSSPAWHWLEQRNRRAESTSPPRRCSGSQKDVGLTSTRRTGGDPQLGKHAALDGRADRPSARGASGPGGPRA